MARRSSGLSCRLQSGHRPRRWGRHGPCIFGSRPASPPARHVICTFHCFRFRLPMAAGHGPCPACSVTPLPRLESLRGCQRRCSRRGRAEASLLTGFVHRRHPSIPPPSLAVAIALGAALRAAASGDSHPLPSAPMGLPLCLRVAPDDRFAATGPTLRLESPSLCPVPAGVASLRLPGRGPLRASLLRSISLHCYLMVRSAVLCADTRRMRAAPLPRSLPLPHCLLPASPCRRETAKGAA
jgi:hypothetical protein